MELLWCQFFIDAYNKGIYEFSKDFLMPGTVLFLTVYFSIYLSKEEFRRQAEKEKIKDDEEKESILKILEMTNPKLIENIEEQLDNLNESKSDFSIDSFNNITFFKANTLIFESISSFGYHKLYTIISEKCVTNDESFYKYWSVISNTPRHQKHIEEYFTYINETYNRINKDLNALNHRIAISCSEIVHSVFEPYETYEVKKSDFETNPSVKLAIQVKEVLDAFKISGASRLRKIHSFLNSLDQLKNDPVSSKVLTAPFAQHVSDALGIVSGIEQLFNVANSSIDNYIDVFTKSKKNLEEMTFTTKAK
ncbi:hypothetical protein [Sphingobacterium yanglingense]|uniref:Uncharacterized protein n=1 Tax=Sphingobacterium yanglingense TaxID=1437280 RepID=A0A4R6W4N6_9SPHI|nr:hypothetical protein [Sphingobacterium yanglingense]TDQ73657.1 hypothetical protein CLV99_4093 [Sphingobacterium yanglingense]